MKKSYTKLLPAAFFFLILSACASTSGTTASSGRGNNNKINPAKDQANNEGEDLSKYRPKFTPPKATAPAATGENPFTPLPGTTPTNHVNERVGALLDTMAIMNKSVRFAKGYRILAYTGTERKAAMDIRNAIISRLPDEQVYAQYKQPTWRVKVGDFFNRLEANQALLRINDIISSPMIVEEQINVK